MCTSDPDPSSCFYIQAPARRQQQRGYVAKRGQGQVLGCEGAGELVVKNVSQGGGTTGEPTLHTLSTRSIVMDFTSKHKFKDKFIKNFHTVVAEH